MTKVNDKIWIEPVSKDKSYLRTSPLLIAKEIDKVACGKVESVRRIGRGVEVQVSNPGQIQKFLDCTIFAGIDAKTSIKQPNYSNRCVIKGVDVDIDANEIKSAIDGCTEAKRITKMVKGSRQTTTAVLLYFEFDIPTHIFWGYEKKKTHVYIPPCHTPFQMSKIRAHANIL